MLYIHVFNITKIKIGDFINRCINFVILDEGGKIIPETMRKVCAVRHSLESHVLDLKKNDPEAAWPPPREKSEPYFLIVWLSGALSGLRTLSIGFSAKFGVFWCPRCPKRSEKCENLPPGA